MEKLRLDLEELTVETFEPRAETRGRGTVRAYDDGSCSNQPTCGIASRGEETYEQIERSFYACCV